MRIPDHEGIPTVSTTQLRTYGAAGFTLDEQETDRGCPRQWKAKYEDERIPEFGDRYALDYGHFIHEVLFAMEDRGLTPEQAIEECFPADGDPVMLAEIRDDLTKYMERGASPVDRFATLATETHLKAVLFVDEEVGPVGFRGFIDWLGIDPDEPNIVHVVDYKSNRQPPTVEQVRGDVQLKSYAWLVIQNARRFGLHPDQIEVVVHLDAVKWREVVVTFTRDEIDDWHTWAVAVTRAILRDTEALPVINPGCATCPVSGDCPAFQTLPQTAVAMHAAGLAIEDKEQLLAWRDAANKVRLLLDKAVKRIDSDLKGEALRVGAMVVGDQRFQVETEWAYEVDLRELHRVMGDPFYLVVGTSKTRVEDFTKTWEPHRLAEVRGCIERVPVGSKVTRKKVEDDE